MNKYKLRAFYLPDLAHSTIYNYIFEYNEETDMFVMLEDKDIQYPSECIGADYQNWIVFMTNIVETREGEENIFRGICHKTNSFEIKDTIDRLKLFNSKIKEDVINNNEN